MGVVIGKDGKTVVIKHSGLLRNVTKIHITRIQRERSNRNEDDNDEAIGRRRCPKVVDEEEDNQKKGVKRGKQRR